MLLAPAAIGLVFLLSADSMLDRSGDASRAQTPQVVSRPAQGRGRLVVSVRSAGRPVAGAMVAIVEGGERFGRTGADGVVTIEGLVDAGTVRLTIESPGLARQVATAEIRGGRGRIEVALEPGVRLVIRVVDEGETSVPSARVRLRPEGRDDALPWEAVTGDDGRVVLDTLEPGPMRIDVDAEGFEPTTRTALPASIEEELRVVARRTGSITGRVLAANGSGAADAEVVLAGSGVWPPRRLTTGGDGRFAIAGVPGGVYELRATRGEEVATPHEGLLLDPGGTAEVELTLAPGVTLEGVVIDADLETPLAGAEVVVTEDALGFAPRAVRTETDGTFRVTGLRAMAHRVSVRAEGFVPRIGEARTPGERAEIGLRRAATLRGVVVDELDHPVAGALLEVTGTGEQGEPITLTGLSVGFRESLFEAQLGGPQPAVAAGAGELGVMIGEVPPIPLTPTATVTATATATDTATVTATDTATATATTTATATAPFTSGPDGRFEITNVPPGRIQIIARHPAYAPGVTPEIAVRVGSVTEDLTIVLPAGGTIDGRVVDNRGFPVGSVRLELVAEREPFPRVGLAAEDGTFEFTAVIGPVSISAFPTGLPAARVEAIVAGGAIVPVTITIEGELHSLAGRTVDDRGFPIAGVRVKIRGTRAQSPLSTSVASGEDGTFEATGLPAPPYRLVADHPEYAVTLMPRVTLPERGRREVSVVLVPGAAVRGRVLDDFSGEPLADARVRLATERPLDNPLETRSLPSGDFEILRVPAGGYTLSIEAAGHLPLSEPVTLRANPRGLDDLDLDARRLALSGTVSGEVIDQLGAPVSGAEVTLATETTTDWARAVRTDPRGRFRLTTPPGRHWITARHPEAGEAEPILTRTLPGEDTPGLLLRLPGRL